MAINDELPLKTTRDNVIVIYIWFCINLLLPLSCDKAIFISLRTKLQILSHSSSELSEHKWAKFRKDRTVIDELRICFRF